MRRRGVVALIGGAAIAWPLALRTQGAQKIPHIGYLSPGVKLSPRERAFVGGLRELGYIDGKNILIEYRFAEGDFGRLPALALELVQLKVDVIVARVTQASLAAKAATKTIPIIMLGVSDPVASGLVASLARSGNNITGTSSQTAAVQGKSLELLRDLVPKLSRVAVLWNPDNAIFQAQMLRATKEGAVALGLELQEFGARNVNDLSKALDAIRRSRVGALFVLGDPILAAHRAQIIDFAAQTALPAMYALEDHTESGGLMSYGPDMIAQFRRGAAYVDKILKGAIPTDLPIEQPTNFRFTINLKTAKALGLQVPSKLLVLAEKIIE